MLRRYNFYAYTGQACRLTTPTPYILQLKGFAPSPGGDINNVKEFGSGSVSLRAPVSASSATEGGQGRDVY